ncbi:CBS domain-containing protein [Chitinimonas naiadis]
MKTARQFLKEKSDPALYAVTPSTTVYQALQLMADADIGAVLVMEGEALVGIFSERDYARKIVLEGKSSAGTPVEGVMTRKVAYAAPSHTLEQCMALMAGNRVRHLPVMESHTVMGVLSISELVREQIADQRFVIEQLEHYIHDIR